MSKNSTFLSFAFFGEAGHGLSTLEGFLTKLLKNNSWHVFSVKEYESRIRGGKNSFTLSISTDSLRILPEKIDILFALIPGFSDHFINQNIDNSLIIKDSSIEEGQNCLSFPFSGITENKKEFINICLLAIVTKITGIEKQNALNILEKFYSGKKSSLLDRSLMIFNNSWDYALELSVSLPERSSENIKNSAVLNGTTATGIGCLCGGCNFISSYPMSPGTGVMTFLCKHRKSAQIITEQTEDEISAILMATGASYSGARSMVTTSGGGFALMQETVSLCGVAEIPIVIHIGQRPGPATGIATRTAQEDLLFTVFSGHGEFPRIVYAPANVEQAIEISAQAFTMADRFQIPVFILTDQYLLDSYSSSDIKELPEESDSYIIPTDKNYKRYALNQSGISPRGIPGYGEGLIRCDSHEHDEHGFISENSLLREKMVEKRMQKWEAIHFSGREPEFFGNEDSKIIIVSWGSNYHNVLKALDDLKEYDLGFIHFSQVFPIPKISLHWLSEAERIIVIENNITCQFASLIKIQLGLWDKENIESIVQYNGHPMTPEFLTRTILGRMGV